MTRTLALCADDFGLRPGVSAGIARLAQAQRLSAVACFTNSPFWPAGAELLQRLPRSVDVGLQLNLSAGRPLSARLGRRWPRLPGLARLALQAQLGLLPRAEVRNEVHAQLAAFIHAFGAPPRFITGHENVHQLPGLREIILDMAEHVQPLPALRSTGRVLGTGLGFRRWLVECSGGRALADALARRVLPHNPALLGLDGLDGPDPAAAMRRWLAVLPADGGLLVCHPGDPEPAGGRDAAAAARERELAYLGSEAFAADLAAAGVVLGRVWQTRTPRP